MPYASDRGLVATGSGRVFCAVDRADALRYVGHAGQVLDAALEERFEQLARQCEVCSDISYVWRIEEVDEYRRFGELAPQVVLAGSGLVLEGVDVARHLSGSKLVGVSAVTLGMGCERELKKLAATNTLDHLLFDCCASSLAEVGAQAVQDILASQARELGLCVHARFSPGYGDLPLDVQPAFLSALDATRTIGLTAISGNFLMPSKSVTAVVGLFDEDTADAAADPCGICAARAYCCYRERGITCRDWRGRSTT